MTHLGGEIGLVWLALFVLPLTLLPSLAHDFGIPNCVILGRLASDQDLLSGCADIVFEHGIFVCPFEQIVHSHKGAF